MSQLELDVRYNKNSSVWNGFKEGRLLVDDKGLVCLSYKMNPVWLALSVQFGLIGALIYSWFANRKKRQMQAVFEQGNPRSLAAEDKDSLVVEFSQIESFEAAKGLFSGGGLKIVAGETTSLQMSKEQREQVLAVLRSKCGGREKVS
jgi:hypothetical protein